MIKTCCSNGDENSLLIRHIGFRVVSTAIQRKFASASFWGMKDHTRVFWFVFKAMQAKTSVEVKGDISLSSCVYTSCYWYVRSVVPCWYTCCHFVLKRVALKIKILLQSLVYYLAHVCFFENCILYNTKT